MLLVRRSGKKTAIKWLESSTLRLASLRLWIKARQLHFDLQSLSSKWMHRLVFEVQQILNLSINPGKWQVQGKKDFESSNWPFSFCGILLNFVTAAQCPPTNSDSDCYSSQTGTEIWTSIQVSTHRWNTTEPKMLPHSRILSIVFNFGLMTMLSIFSVSKCQFSNNEPKFKDRLRQPTGTLQPMTLYPVLKQPYKGCGLHCYNTTVWPNVRYSEKMPRHSGPYWGVVWTFPITSIPRAKCSTWKLGQNGLI